MVGFRGIVPLQAVNSMNERIERVRLDKEFTAKKLSREAKPSIRKALSVLREAAGRNVQRAKEKIRERGMER